jgi:hypothetical protein
LAGYDQRSTIFWLNESDEDIEAEFCEYQELAALPLKKTNFPDGKLAPMTRQIA